MCVVCAGAGMFVCVGVGVGVGLCVCLYVVPRKPGMRIYLPVTTRPLYFLQQEVALSLCNFVITH